MGLVDWFGLAGGLHRRMQLRNPVAGLMAGPGAARAIGAMGVARSFPTLLAVIAFATSIVPVKGSPEAEHAQPRALVGGHVVATWRAS